MCVESTDLTSTYQSDCVGKREVDPTESISQAYDNFKKATVPPLQRASSMNARFNRLRAPVQEKRTGQGGGISSHGFGSYMMEDPRNT